MMKYLQQFIVLMSVMALAVLHCPASIFGQTTIAIQGGMNRATIGGDDAAEEGLDVGARTGLKVGASATIPIQNRFGLQLSGNYVQKGFQSDIDSDFLSEFTGIGNFSLDLNIDYIEFSGLGIAQLVSPESPASLYLLAGPSVAFNTRCEVEVGDGSTTVKVDCGDDEVDIQIESVDLGITGGIGTEMAISERMTFSVELLYTLGIRSIYSEEDDIKNRALAFQVGVGFPIGK